ncbi:MAG: hypothetical protein Tsb005_03920 [Gammaproteobacteria bacterium]
MASIKKVTPYCYQILSLFFSLLISMLSMSAQANPQGGVVTSGQASISQSPGLTTIYQSSDQAILEWQSFNIGSGERTHFQQPNSSSVTLNRINAANGVSQIFGTLTATGHIFLVNPAGIVFGPNAKVDVAGLVATTANISDNDFLARNYRFTQDPNFATSSIINYGDITVREGGLAALVAPGVANHGVITAKLGKIGLGAGKAFTIDLYGDELIQFTAGSTLTDAAKDEHQQPLAHAVNNQGTLAADGGYIQLTASSADHLMDHVINMEGVVRANTVNTHGGRIVLGNGTESSVRLAGSLVARGDEAGETGGSVQILGQDIHIDSGTRIDVSGDIGGGDINIGGNYQGIGPLPNAQTTYIGPDSQLYANAITDGQGGEIIVWANGRTDFYGLIEARGGALGGDGGFVEVSGKETLVYGGTVDLRAPQGEFGDLLLDPYNLTIQDASSQTIGQSSGTFTSFTSNADNSRLDVNVLNSALELANVLVQTGSGGSQAGNIELLVGTAINWAADTTLTLLAANSVSIRGTITNTGSGNLNIIAQGVPSTAQTISVTGGITLTDGDVNFFYNPLAGFPNADSFSNVITTNGTFTPYILINNATQLQAIGGSSNAFALSGDIDVNNGSFTPISNFGGILDGSALSNALFQNDIYTISNVIINQPSTNNVGLFATTSSTAVIRNLLLDNISVTGSSSVGALVGSNTGDISNVHASNVLITGNSNVGGLVGLNNASTADISDVSTSGLIERTTTSTTGAEFGGIVGDLNLGTISRAFSSVDIEVANLSLSVGGIVGRFNIATVTDVVADSVITVGGSNPQFIGGVVGAINPGGTLNQAVSLGSIIINSSAGANIGGLAGGTSANVTAQINDSFSLATINAPNATNVAGFIGSHGGTITNSYAANPFIEFNSGAAFANLTGGVSSVTNSFYNSDIHNITDSSGATAITTAQMQQQSTFTNAGWDFVNTWNIIAGETYPFLRAQTSSGTPAIISGNVTTGGGSPISQATISFVNNGSLLDQVVTGVDGFYYQYFSNDSRFANLDTAPAIPTENSIIIAFLENGASQTDEATRVGTFADTNTRLTGFDLNVNELIIDDIFNLGISRSGLATALGAFTDADLLLSVSGNTLTVGGLNMLPNIDVSTTTNTVFTIDGGTIQANDANFTFNGAVNASNTAALTNTTTGGVNRSVLLNDVLTVDGSSFTITAASGNDQVIINDAQLINSGSLTVQTNSGNDQITLNNVQGSAGSTMTINTGMGQDTLQLGSSSGGISNIDIIAVLHSGGGASSFTLENFNNVGQINVATSGNDDTLTLRGSANNVIHDFISATVGNVLYNNTIVTYQNVIQVNDLLTATNKDINFNSSATPINVTDAGGGLTNIASNTSPGFDVSLDTDTLVIDANNGNDAINVTSFSENFSGNLQINGNGGDDTITINGVGSNFTGTLITAGGTGEDQINLNALPNTFAYAIDGGSGNNDTLIIGNSAIGAGITVDLANVVITSLTDQSVIANSIANIERYVAATNTGNNTVVGPNTSNQWQLSTEDSPIVNNITLEGFSHVIGGSGSDYFTFTNPTGVTPINLTGSLDGGAGYDTLDFSALTSPITFVLTGLGSIDGLNATQTAAVAGSIRNINRVIASSQAGDILVTLPIESIITLGSSNRYATLNNVGIDFSNFDFIDLSATPLTFLNGQIGGSLVGKRGNNVILRLPSAGGEFRFNGIQIRQENALDFSSFERDVQTEKTSQYTSPEQAKQNVCTANGGSLGMAGCASIIIKDPTGQRVF